MTACPCHTCRNVGPEHEESQAARGAGPGPRPVRHTIPDPPPDWWGRVEAASDVNWPDDPAAYEWPTTEKDHDDATQ